MKENEIYCGDTIEIMKEMKDKSVQLIFTSPPYNASFRNDGLKYPAGNCNDKITDKEYIDWSVSIFKEYERIIKDKGVVAYNMSYTSKSPSLPYQVISAIIKETGFKLLDTMVWKKKSVVPLATSPNRLTRICEFVYIFSKNDNFDCNKEITKVSKQGQNFFKTYYNFIETKNNDGSIEEHKATFSTDFAKHFIQLYSFEGSLVLDNFIGTGTTAIGCIELNRNYIGIDMCQTYVDLSNERINKLKNKNNE